MLVIGFSVNTLWHFVVALSLVLLDRYSEIQSYFKIFVAFEGIMPSVMVYAI